MQRCPKCGEIVEFIWEGRRGKGPSRLPIPYKLTRRGTYMRHVCKIIPEYMKHTHDLGGVEQWGGE